VRERLVEMPLPQEWTVEDIATVAQGLFRFDREAFDRWFLKHERDLLAMLQFGTRSLSLRLIRPSCALDDGPEPVDEQKRDVADAKGVSATAMHRDELRLAQEDAARFGSPSADVKIVFAVDSGNDDPKPNEQTMERLQLLRRTLPFAGHYCSRGEYFLPDDVELPVDDTVKAIPRWHLPFPSDVNKNVVWRTVVAKPYVPDTIYRMQEAWFETRLVALRLVQAYVAVFRRVLRGQPSCIERELGSGLEVQRTFEMASTRLARFSDESLRWIDTSVASALALLLKTPAPNQWITSLGNFSSQLWQYLLKNDAHMGRLALHNCHQAADSVDAMHAFFKVFFQETPDYFEACALEPKEAFATERMALLFEGIVDPLGWKPADPVHELRRRAKKRATDRLDRIQNAVATIVDESGFSILAPTGVAREGTLTSVPLGIEIANPAEPQSELIAVAFGLASISELVDRLWLIPLRDGARLGENGYGIGTGILREGASALVERTAFWQFLVPTPVPSQVLTCLPPLDVSPLPEVGLRERLLKLRYIAELYARRRHAIASITEGRDHPFLVKLSRHERERLADVEQEVGELAGSIELDLTKVEILARGSEFANAVSKARGFVSGVLALVEATEISRAPQVPDSEEIQKIVVELGS